MKDANTSGPELAALWKSEKPAEEHRLGCCDGGFENNEVQKLQSMSSGMSENGHIDILYRKITHLKETNAKLHNDVAFLKYSLFLSILVTIVTAITIVYILKIDIKHFMDQHSYRETGHIHNGL